jgi:hypothetical protein
MPKNVHLPAAADCPSPLLIAAYNSVVNQLEDVAKELRQIY